ncbi:TPA: helix-turn-helix domain-containing protein [Streptococcus suis]
MKGDLKHLIKNKSAYTFNKEALLWAIQVRHQKSTHLADRVGISRSTMSRILNGVNEPTLEVFLMIARQLRLTLDELHRILNVGGDNNDRHHYR